MLSKEVTFKGSLRSRAWRQGKDTFSPALGAYQVTWGGGEPWTVQVSRTVVCSQTACERRGIQNQGPRPEHSSRSSLASRTFSSVWRQEGPVSLRSQGNASPVFAVTFPLMPRLDSPRQPLTGSMAQRAGRGALGPDLKSRPNSAAYWL